VELLLLESLFTPEEAGVRRASELAARGLEAIQYVLLNTAS